ncbi:MAG: MaoC/PaaZ C-terminal domain-containing protein [Planctomycetota bacterium]
MPRSGLCYDEFQVGQRFITASRTITETDVVLFAGLSGDYNPLHTDDVFAASTPYRKRIAHGALGVAIATGLANRLGVFEGTTIAILGLEVHYRRPIYINDTVTLHLEVKEKKPPQRGERGLVVFNTLLINQSHRVTADGTWTLMMKTKATMADATSPGQGPE